MENVELKSIVIEIKNSLEGLKSRSEQAEKWINKFKDRSLTDYASWRIERKNNEKRMNNFRDTWITMKHVNIYLMGTPGGDERDKEEEENI